MRSITGLGRGFYNNVLAQMDARQQQAAPGGGGGSGGSCGGGGSGSSQQQHTAESLRQLLADYKDAFGDEWKQCARLMTGACLFYMCIDHSKIQLNDTKTDVDSTVRASLYTGMFRAHVDAVVQGMRDDLRRHKEKKHRERRAAQAAAAAPRQPAAAAALVQLAGSSGAGTSSAGGTQQQVKEEEMLPQLFGAAVGAVGAARAGAAAPAAAARLRQSEKRQQAMAAEQQRSQQAPAGTEPRGHFAPRQQSRSAGGKRTAQEAGIGSGAGGSSGGGAAGGAAPAPKRVRVSARLRQFDDEIKALVFAASAAGANNPQVVSAAQAIREKVADMVCKLRAQFGTRDAHF